MSAWRKYAILKLLCWERDTSMKRKFADRANWRRVIQRNYSRRYVNNSLFTGYVTLYRMNRLREPLYKIYGGRRFCIAAAGYSWMQYYPEHANYVVTAMFDDKREIIEWYIDICKTQGLTDQGVPWFDDLYLDIVVMKDGQVFLLDEDELDDALRKQIITDQDYELAQQTAQKLLVQIDAHAFPLFTLSIKHRQSLFGKDSNS
ncbi:putative RNA-binding protein associated with RNAse of E/G family [Paenibacillus sp. SORGH_AS306]|nr:putative RNA-binding protein associated with RNAse of E/G family [Paenibacillus sp. SORGH_AS_0306]MDR6111574.1 putative RNA-binding protein associated with RNAse of E/G family [Paenibacillus sp. SORGH_AS_0338]